MLCATSYTTLSRPASPNPRRNTVRALSVIACRLAQAKFAAAHIAPK
jgi:hypothetical protein